MLKRNLKVLLVVIILLSTLSVCRNSFNYDNKNDRFINENNIEIYTFDNIEYASIKDLCHSFWFNSKYDVKYDGFNQFSLFSKSERKIIFKHFEFTEIYGNLYFKKDYFENNILELIMD